MQWLSELGISAGNPAACAGPEWLQGSQHFESINPATGEPIARVGLCSPEQYETVVAHAVARAAHWRSVPAPQRGEIVRLAASELRRNKEMLGRLIALETGKIEAEGGAEVQEMIDIAEFAVGLSRQLYGQTMHSERPHHRLYEQWHPLGAIAVITAFNFPTAVWAWNAFIAAVAGDTVVWKPSPKAPLCAIAVQHMLNRVMKEAGSHGIFSLLLANDAALPDRLVHDRRLPLVSFTGSSAAGRQVAEIVARRMGRCLLECSGNNAVIVDENADLDLATRAIVFGALGTAGQRCTSTRRLIVHEASMAPVLERLAHAYAQVRVRIGDPLDPRTLMGPLIDEAARSAFNATVTELRQLGAEIVYGSRALPEPGYFVEPTIVRSRPEWKAVRRECFAPLLHVMSFRTLDDAIAMNNAVPQGLASALFTTDLRHAEAFLSVAGSDCGIANIK
ncbi:MAG: aldehyde dehydrogenase family protein, partial [Burkholderiales bacterium]